MCVSVYNSYYLQNTNSIGTNKYDFHIYIMNTFCIFYSLYNLKLVHMQHKFMNIMNTKKSKKGEKY